MAIHAIMVHGMGRTPFSQHGLALRLRRLGLKSHIFGYCAALESFEGCQNRLQKFIDMNCGEEDFIIIGHSLGCILLRSVLPKLRRQPLNCFFLAMPTVACRAAKFFKTNYLFKMLTGDMGQLLSNEDFMASVPMPHTPSFIYVGTAGPRGRWSPFLQEENDGILAISETIAPGCQEIRVNALHTFIMNSREVVDHMLAALREYHPTLLV